MHQRCHPCYDLAVIGSGPAGQKAALNAAKLGRRVALIDRALQRRRGLHPYRHHSLQGDPRGRAPPHRTARALLYGDSYAVKQDITMQDLLYRSNHVVRTEVEVIRNQMHRNGVSMLYGEASFVDPHTLRVSRGASGEHPFAPDETTEVRAEHVLIAVGTEPARPQDVPFTAGRIIDSNELLELASCREA